MFKIQVKSRFDAAHHLRGYPGKCARVHGHTWTAVATVSVWETKGKTGISLDFNVLKRLIEDYDHQDLNALPQFRRVNPTAENIAVDLFWRIKAEMERLGVRGKVIKTQIFEGKGSPVTYRK